MSYILWGRISFRLQASSHSYGIVAFCDEVAVSFQGVERLSVSDMAVSLSQNSFFFQQLLQFVDRKRDGSRNQKITDVVFLVSQTYILAPNPDDDPSVRMRRNSSSI